MENNQSFKNLSEAQKINLLHQLVKMAKADKIFKFVELKYLTEIAELMNISATRLDDIINADKIGPLPKTMLERARQLYRLTVMMMIDQVITTEELNLLKTFAVELGLQANGVEVMIEAMNQNKGGMLLNKQLIKIFAIELN